MKRNLHRTFKTRNQRQDQTKEQKDLALVNYMTESENRCCQESHYRNKILLLKRSLLYLRALEFQTLQLQLEWLLDCLRSPETFIRQLHLFHFVHQSRYRLYPRQQLQLQQPTSVTPVVSVQSFMNQSHASPFPAVNTSSSRLYVPSLMQQLHFSGGQSQFMPTGRNQPSSQSTADQISADSSPLLKRVSVPEFFGQKKNYEAWKAAFYSSVDCTGATPEYKLLRL